MLGQLSSHYLAKGTTQTKMFRDFQVCSLAQPPVSLQRSRNSTFLLKTYIKNFLVPSFWMDGISAIENTSTLP